MLMKFWGFVCALEGLLLGLQRVKGKFKDIVMNQDTHEQGPDQKFSLAASPLLTLFTLYSGLQ